MLRQQSGDAWRLTQVCDSQFRDSCLNLRVIADWAATDVLDEDTILPVGENDQQSLPVDDWGFEMSQW